MKKNDTRAGWKLYLSYQSDSRFCPIKIILTERLIGNRKHHAAKIKQEIKRKLVKFFKGDCKKGWEWEKNEEKYKMEEKRKKILGRGHTGNRSDTIHESLIPESTNLSWTRLKLFHFAWGQRFPSFCRWLSHQKAVIAVTKCMTGLLLFFLGPEKKEYVSSNWK
jgi:hypothetical protein